jgi:hypothetical protein
MKNTCHFRSLQNLLLIILQISTYTSKFCYDVIATLILGRKMVHKKRSISIATK